MPGESRELMEARGLLARFEAEMRKPEGIAHLSEALELLGDIRDAGESDRDALVATNIAQAYATKVQREIEGLAREQIVHMDTILHWLSVLREFENAGFPLTAGLESARSTLLLKKMSPSERQVLLQKLQANNQDDKTV
jgi:hypothetical protein